MTRKVTPTGVLVLPASAPRDEWLAARKTGITATDLPKILGVTEYGTPIDVWMDKLGQADNDFNVAIGENEAAFWGIEFEDVVARAWAKHRGFSIRRVGIIRHQDHAWQLATLDRLVKGCPDGRCAIEVKTRGAFVREAWEQGVPADVAAQVEWQLMVSGLDHIHVIALVGGQKLNHDHIIRLADVDTANLTAKAQIVWQAVQTGEAPILPRDVWTDPYLEQLYPDHVGTIEVDTDTATTVTAYQDATQQIKLLTDRKNELRTLLVGALGEYEVATYNTKPLYTYKSSTNRRLDSKALAANYPDIAADDAVHTITETRTLRLSTEKETK